MLRSRASIAWVSFDPVYLTFRFSIIHSKAPHQVALFDESMPEMQRVLKFPVLTRRLNASSQLNGSFSIGPPARGSRSFFLPLLSAVGTWTAFHLSWNEIPVSRFSFGVQFETSDANVETVEALNFGGMSAPE